MRPGLCQDPGGGAYSVPPSPLAGFSGERAQRKSREGEDGKGGEEAKREEQGREVREGPQQKVDKSTTVWDPLISRKLLELES